LNWWKTEESTPRGYNRMKQHCQAWMHGDDWTPESIIERLKKTLIDQEDWTLLAGWFNTWNAEIRLRQKNRDNANKRWVKKRERDADSSGSQQR